MPSTELRWRCLTADATRPNEEPNPTKLTVHREPSGRIPLWICVLGTLHHKRCRDRGWQWRGTVLEPQHGRLLQTYRSTSRFLADAVIDPDRAMIIASGSDGLLWFWDLTGHPLWKLRAHKSHVVGIVRW